MNNSFGVLLSLALLTLSGCDAQLAVAPSPPPAPRLPTDLPVEPAPLCGFDEQCGLYEQCDEQLRADTYASVELDGGAGCCGECAG